MVQPLQVRIGVHSGAAVAGIIGKHKFIYDVWGDTVNTANRMESHGVPNRVQISAATFHRVRDVFRCEPRGPQEVKGKGMMSLSARLSDTCFPTSTAAFAMTKTPPEPMSTKRPCVRFGMPRSCHRICTREFLARYLAVRRKSSMGRCKPCVSALSRIAGRESRGIPCPPRDLSHSSQ